MLEILILIHSNRFLMNKIKIRLLLMKIPSLTEEIWPPLVKSVSVLSGICWCEYYIIKYFIYNNFTVFCKNFKLEIKNLK